MLVRLARALPSDSWLLRAALLVSLAQAAISLLVVWRDPSATLAFNLSPLLVQFSAAPTTFLVLTLSLVLAVVCAAVPIMRHLPGHLGHS